MLIESYEGGWPTMRQHKFFHNVTADHLEDIMSSPPPQEKSSRPGFTGYISSEMHAFPTNDARNVINFLKRLFTRFGIPKALIIDRVTHFCNYQMEKAMKRLFPRKLKLRWYRPFSMCKDMKNGAIELYDEDGNGFIVDKQRVKPYQKSVLDTNKDDDITLDDEGEVTLCLMKRSLKVLREFHWIILGG
ncbi:putative reverse transcriptase domain-containing protein [Tanacetum coccineum]